MSQYRSPSLSPPPLKRRRISQLPPTSDSPTPQTSTTSPLTSPPVNTFRILSWNINGIDAFLPARPHNQKAITTFFPPSKAPDSAPPSHNGSHKTRTQRPSLRACLLRWGWPHIVCLQEVKIARSDTRTQDLVRRIANRSTCSDFLEHGSSDDEDIDSGEHGREEGGERDSRLEYDTYFSLPLDPHNARGAHGNGRIYGVCTLVRRDLCPLAESNDDNPSRKPATTTQPVDWDLEGRVLVTVPSTPPPTTTQSRNPLAVFNIYAVNGSPRPYRDPQTGSLAGDRHAYKRRFHALLADSVRAYQRRGYSVVVAGDMNISRSAMDSYPALRTGAEHVTNRADFEARFMEKEGGLGMGDCFRVVRGERRKYTFWPRGREWGTGMDRVDLMLCSGDVVGRDGGEGDEEGSVPGRRGLGGWRLVDADILDTSEERGPSDHVPLYIDLSCVGTEGFQSEERTR